MQPIFQACTVGVQDGRARCRNERGKCSVHARPQYYTAAPRPDVVLFKINVNEKRESRLSKAGVPYQVRSYDRALQLEQQRVASAQSLGRDAYAVRELSHRDSHHTPEAADTGCPVFGKNGLADLNVSAANLLKELFDAGFVLTGGHLLKREHKPPIRLVLEFGKPSTKPAILKFPWEEVKSLLATTFNQVDVWANERDKDGKVVHTINCGKRDDNTQPKTRIHYAGGDWDVETLAVSSVA